MNKLNIILVILGLIALVRVQGTTFVYTGYNCQLYYGEKSGQWVPGEEEWGPHPYDCNNHVYWENDCFVCIGSCPDWYYQMCGIYAEIVYAYIAVANCIDYCDPVDGCRNNGE